MIYAINILHLSKYSKLLAYFQAPWEFIVQEKGGGELMMDEKEAK